MQFELTGTLIDVFSTQTFNKGFRKREFVLETNDKYPQKILFTLVQDKCDMLDSYSIGDTISVQFDVKGREWQDKGGNIKYFVTLEGTRISGKGRVEKNVPNNEEDEDEEIFKSLGISSEKPKTPKNKKVDYSDDLPFDL